MDAIVSYDVRFFRACQDVDTVGRYGFLQNRSCLLKDFWKLQTTVCFSG